MQCVSQTNTNQVENDVGIHDKDSSFMWSSSAVSFVKLKVCDFLFKYLIFLLILTVTKLISAIVLNRKKGPIRHIGIFLNKNLDKKKRLANDEPQSMQIRKLLSAKNERCDSWMFSIFTRSAWSFLRKHNPP